MLQKMLTSVYSGDVWCVNCSGILSGNQLHHRITRKIAYVSVSDTTDLKPVSIRQNVSVIW